MSARESPGRLSPDDRLDAFAAYGLTIYLDATGALCMHGPAPLVAAARPALRVHRAEITNALRVRLDRCAADPDAPRLSPDVLAHLCTRMPR